MSYRYISGIENCFLLKQMPFQMDVGVHKSAHVSQVFRAMLASFSQFGPHQ